jgi:AcrR family transcriptional regulator
MAIREVRDGAAAPPLSRDRVLTAAVELADERGIEALSMRTLAQELGAGAMSLYHHVKGKDELHAGMVDLVVQEWALPAPDGDWKDSIRACVISAHDALVRHPWAANLMFAVNVNVGSTRFRWMDALLGRLRDAGFSANLTHLAYHALDAHIMGFTLWQSSITRVAPNLQAIATDFAQRIPASEYPWLVEHMEQHTRPREPGAVTEFDFALDLLLDGLDRLRDGPRKRRGSGSPRGAARAP